MRYEKLAFGFIYTFSLVNIYSVIYFFVLKESQREEDMLQNDSNQMIWTRVLGIQMQVHKSMTNAISQQWNLYLYTIEFACFPSFFFVVLIISDVLTWCCFSLDLFLSICPFIQLILILKLCLCLHISHGWWGPFDFHSLSQQRLYHNSVICEFELNVKACAHNTIHFCGGWPSFYCYLCLVSTTNINESICIYLHKILWSKLNTHNNSF